MESGRNDNHDLFNLLDSSARELAFDACVKALRLRSLPLFEKGLEWQSVHTQNSKGILDKLMRAVPERVAALSAFQLDVLDLAERSKLRAAFEKTNDGQILLKAWHAILDADLETLVTINAYAPNYIGTTDVTRKIFWTLVEQAGITILSGGSGGGNERHGNFTFMLGEKGLYVAYDLTYHENKEVQSYSSAVVTGTIVKGPLGLKLNESSAPNTDPAAVKEMARAVAACLLAHYTPADMNLYLETEGLDQSH